LLAFGVERGNQILKIYLRTAVSGLDFTTGIMDCFQERHPADFVVFSYSFLLSFVSVFARSSHDTNERRKELKIKKIAVKAYENSP
jgi:hypothetical protein